MNTYPVTSLAELIRLERRPIKVEQDGEYKEIGIYCFGRGIFHKQPRSGLEVGDKHLYLIREGDLILQVTFAWEGAVALCSSAEDGLFGSTRYPTFRVNEERCYPPFLARYLITPDGLKQIGRICPGSAGRNRVLSIRRIHEIVVPLPPLEEQRRIVARIEKLDAKIAEASSLRKQATQETKAMFGRIAAKTFQNSIEQTWATTLENLTNRITKGESPEWQGFSYQDIGPVFVRSENVLWGSLDLQNVVHIPEQFHRKLIRSQLRSGDILLNLVGASIGRACVVPENLACDANVNQAVAVITPIAEKLNSRFLLLVLLSDDIQKRIHSGKVETARPNISLRDLRKLLVPVPTITKQLRIVAELDRVRAELDALDLAQAQTAKQLDALLPSIINKAFKGEL